MKKFALALVVFVSFQTPSFADDDYTWNNRIYSYSEDIEGMVPSILELYAPDSWSTANGQGRYHVLPGRYVLVKQLTEVHGLIEADVHFEQLEFAPPFRDWDETWEVRYYERNTDLFGVCENVHDLLKHFVFSGTWEYSGGPGTIVCSNSRVRFAVAQFVTAHEAIEELLNAINDLYPDDEAFSNVRN